MKEEISTFHKLNSINVNEFTKKKGTLTYLSWANAVAALLAEFPTATWEIIRFDGMPFCKTELGYFVEVAVTINGVTRSCMLPILDHRNKPIPQPTTFDINTSQQRALTKAISFHGLGLYIYAGEDLPLDEAVKTADIVITVNDDLKAAIDTCDPVKITKAWVATKDRDVLWSSNSLTDKQREAITTGINTYNKMKKEAA